tara:strand:- start:2738 stop:3577 length:840 start_codon:yes stop_codon:yes gene_type:complete
MNIGIVGLGLIGGSIGLKLQKLNHNVYGIVNNSRNKKIALERNLATNVSCDLKLLKNCSLIILALPIKDLVNPTNELISSLPSEAVVTDVGSIKEPIIKKWEKIHPLFIGSHPMSGTERKGVEAGNENLFNKSKWIITPTSKTNPTSLDILTKLISSMDCEIYQASPKEHDEAVSLISHLPIFLSSSLISTVNIKQNQSLLTLTRKIASSGFLDTSRVGGGNPVLGVDLAIHNQSNILRALKIFKENINEIESIIEEKNWNLLSKMLEESKRIRSLFSN